MTREEAAQVLTATLGLVVKSEGKIVNPNVSKATVTEATHLAIQALREVKKVTVPLPPAEKSEK